MDTELMNTCNWSYEWN